MVHKDYYKALGLSEGAHRSDIDSAYRKLSLKLHPDRNKDFAAIEEFALVAEAYDALSEPERKAIYDRFGYAGLAQGAPKGESEFTQPYTFHGDALKVFQIFFGTENPFHDLYPAQDEFGFSAQHDIESHRTRKVQDAAIERDLSVSLEEVYLGCVKKMKMSRRVLSEDGYSTTVKDKIFTINVRPGWKEGTKVTFSKDGDQGPNNIPADVVFVVKYKPHARFVREGRDLVHTCSVSLSDALTGCILELVTLDGRKLSLPVNDIIRPGYEMRVPGEGMPDTASDTKGDLIVRFKIGFPASLSEDKKLQIRQALA